MTSINSIVDYLEQILEPGKFRDYCPNGLQVEGKSSIKKIVTGVTACQEFIDKAIAAKADAVLVHHGFFWKGEPSIVTGVKRQRLKALLGHDLNLLAYHLPLDAHPRYGNNVKLAEVLALTNHGPVSENGMASLVFKGNLAKPLSGAEFANHIEQCLNRKPLHIAGQHKIVQTVAWCTGAAQDAIVDAIDAGVDAFITGEVSERTFHMAKESGIHFYSAGHHATERYGIQALGEHLAEYFPVQHQFIDVENPV
ncbi:MAG: Nif3-like dinuclear metal center hexameric protein [Legionellales bacterium]|nr:Nif3-like dinuclear metal center hexameric protein [Legionellales bacterium]|tara:strand:- start:1234 stop:1992 length:759 start_codon:yes stop_codon:yes gene_type:complete